MATHAVKNFIRNRDFFKIISALETGAEHGMWTFQRYAKWLESRTNLVCARSKAEPPDSEPADPPPIAAAAALRRLAQSVGKKSAGPTSRSERGQTD